jgi:hypothetical protein
VPQADDANSVTAAERVDTYEHCAIHLADRHDPRFAIILASVFLLKPRTIEQTDRQLERKPGLTSIANALRRVLFGSHELI